MQFYTSSKNWLVIEVDASASIKSNPTIKAAENIPNKN
jgi:hypothetical protein